MVNSTPLIKLCFMDKIYFNLCSLNSNISSFEDKFIKKFFTTNLYEEERDNFLLNIKKLLLLNIAVDRYLKGDTIICRRHIVNEFPKVDFAFSENLKKSINDKIDLIDGTLSDNLLFEEVSLEIKLDNHAYEIKILQIEEFEFDVEGFKEEVLLINPDILNSMIHITNGLFNYFYKNK